MLLLGRFFIRNHKAGNEIKKIRFASQKLNKKKSPVILVSCQRRSEWSILCRRSWKRRTKKTKKDFSGVRHVVTFRLDISSLYIVDFHPLCFALNNIKRFSFYSHRKPFNRRKCETWNRFLLSWKAVDSDDDGMRERKFYACWLNDLLRTRFLPSSLFHSLLNPHQPRPVTSKTPEILTNTFSLHPAFPKFQISSIRTSLDVNCAIQHGVLHVH